MYALIHDVSGKLTGANRLADGATIPVSDGNRDWRRFLAWNVAQPSPLDLSDLPSPPVVPPTEADKLDATFMPSRVTAALAIRSSDRWAALSAARKARLQAIINDGADAAIARLS